MIRNLLLILALGILWGFNWPAVRLALAEIPPWTLRAVAFWLATALLVQGFGVVGATLILGERPTWPDRVGLFLIVAASASVIFGRPPAATARRAGKRPGRQVRMH